MIELPAKTEEKVVDYFVIDETFPSGKYVSFGTNKLASELRGKYQGCYLQLIQGSTAAKKRIVRVLADPTVKEVASLSRHEVTIEGYWLRYWHLRFVPEDGYWIDVR